MANEFEHGLLVGILIGEGHFGGDGRQPQVTLRMHVRHEPMFRWLERTYPGGRLYGPYNHDGRNYFQWMARGRFLRDELVPLLERHLRSDIDAHSLERFQQMCSRYAHRLGRTPGGEDEAPVSSVTSPAEPLADAPITVLATCPVEDGSTSDRASRSANRVEGSRVPSASEALDSIFDQLRRTEP